MIVRGRHQRILHVLVEPLLLGSSHLRLKDTRLWKCILWRDNSLLHLHLCASGPSVHADVMPHNHKHLHFWVVYVDRGWGLSIHLVKQSVVLLLIVLAHSVEEVELCHLKIHVRVRIHRRFDGNVVRVTVWIFAHIEVKHDERRHGLWGASGPLPVDSPLPD